MSDILIASDQVSLQCGARPRAGAVAVDGKFADEDMEIVIQICVGCVKKSALVDAQGNGRGAMVPVGLVSRSLVEIRDEAEKILNPRPALVAV